MVQAAQDRHRAYRAGATPGLDRVLDVAALG